MLLWLSVALGGFLWLSLFSLAVALCSSRGSLWLSWLSVALGGFLWLPLLSLALVASCGSRGALTLLFFYTNLTIKNPSLWEPKKP